MVNFENAIVDKKEVKDLKTNKDGKQTKTYVLIEKDKNKSDKDVK